MNELEKLLAEATPGPWRTVGDGSRNMAGVHAGPHDSDDSYLLFTLYNDPNDDGPMGNGGLLPETVERWKADARLIVAAVNALPELVAKVKRLEGALETIANPATYSHSLLSCCQHTFDDTCELFSDIARAALNQETKP